MRRRWAAVAALSATPAAALVLAPDAVAAHGPRGIRTHAITSSGFPWDTVVLWAAVGIAVVLLLAWVVDQGRRRRWHLHRPAHV